LDPQKVRKGKRKKIEENAGQAKELNEKKVKDKKHSIETLRSKKVISNKKREGYI
jgi:hypothetical protein